MGALRPYRYPSVVVAFFLFSSFRSLVDLFFLKYHDLRRAHSKDLHDVTYFFLSLFHTQHVFQNESHVESGASLRVNEQCGGGEDGGGGFKEGEGNEKKNLKIGKEVRSF